MHNLWSGYITFGLVTIPVNMFPATESKSVAFNFVHTQCGTPLKYDRICAKCNAVIPWRDVSRGYEYEKGKWVTIDENDLKSVPFPKGKNIDIVQFVDLSEISTFGGDPDEFYDGVHIKAANARRVIVKLIRTFPGTFSEGAGD